MRQWNFFIILKKTKHHCVQKFKKNIFLLKRIILQKSFSFLQNWKKTFDFARKIFWRNLREDVWGEWDFFSHVDAFEDLTNIEEQEKLFTGCLSTCNCTFEDWSIVKSVFLSAVGFFFLVELRHNDGWQCHRTDAAQFDRNETSVWDKFSIWWVRIRENGTVLWVMSLSETEYNYTDQSSNRSNVN